MTTTTTTLPNRNAHYWQTVAYLQTVTHLQKGEWEEALRGLEQLLVHHPDDQRLRRALEDVRYKAQLDGESRIRTRRWLFPYQKWIDRIALGAGVFVLLWMGAAFAYQRSQVNAIRAQQATLHEAWLREADLFLNADDLASAEQRLNRILADAPNDTNALVKLATVKQSRDLLYRYQEAVAKQATGDCAAAVEIFDELQSFRSGYRDVSKRLEQCTQQQHLSQLLNDATRYERAGQLRNAIQAYEESRQLGAKRLSDGTALATKLAILYVRAGSDPLKSSAITAQQLQEAQSMFTAALQVDPQNANATTEAQLLNRYLAARNAAESKDWAAAVSNLRTVYEERSDYLGGTVVTLLYNAYIGLGDGYRATGDCNLALQRYSAAAALPVVDSSLARTRSNLGDCGTQPVALETQPSPEPLTLVNPGVNLDTELPTTAPTEIPTPQPPATLQLATLHNRIVFKSSNQAQPGFWAMAGDGSNRQFLGGIGDSGLLAEYNTLLGSYRTSPDGEFHVFVGEVYEKSQVFIGRLDGAWPDRPLTQLTGIAYDPQWSPINGAIIFVSQEDGSDDIWFIGADGESQHSLVRNTWEWDKNPTWSPDGSQIAFWSNRTGLKQIFVMNADGKEVHNVSNTGWDEYEPLWIR